VIVIEHGAQPMRVRIQMPAAASYSDEYEALCGVSVGNLSPIFGAVAVLGVSARQGHRRKLIDQRHGLCARPMRANYDHWAGKAVPMGGLARMCCPYFKTDGNRGHWQGGTRLGVARWSAAFSRAVLGDNSAGAGLCERRAEAGLRDHDDYNGEKQEGFGPFEADVHIRRAVVSGNAYRGPH